MTALLPLVSAVVGMLVYGLSANAKVAEMGRIVFACAVLVLLFGAAGHVVKF